MLAMILVSEKPRERHQLLCALSRRHVGEVHVLTGPQEAPHRSVVRAGALLGGVEGSTAEAHAAACPNLGGVGAGRTHADAAVARSSPTARRHDGAVVACRRQRAAEGDGEMERAAEGAAIYRRAGRGAPNLARELPPFPARASFAPPLERA